MTDGLIQRGGVGMGQTGTEEGEEEFMKEEPAPGGRSLQRRTPRRAGSRGPGGARGPDVRPPEL